MYKLDLSKEKINSLVNSILSEKFLPIEDAFYEDLVEELETNDITIENTLRILTYYYYVANEIAKKLKSNEIKNKLIKLIAKEFIRNLNYVINKNNEEEFNLIKNLLVNS